MGFFDQPLSKDTDLKYNKNVIKDPILYSDSENPDLYILIERPYSKVIMDEYVKLVKGEIPGIQIQLISVLSIFVKDQNIKGNVQDFYVENKIKIEDYIPPYSKVIADRRSIVALNESDDLEVEGFYDIIFNEPYYYNPQYKLTVFPIDPITYWVHKDPKKNQAIVKDKWVKFFSLRQAKKAYQYKVNKRRHKKINLVTVENPNQWLQEQNQLNIEYVAWDIETNSLDPWAPNSRILELTMSFDGVTGYYLPWDKIDTKVLSEFLRGKKQILQNGKFDAKFVILNGVDRDAINIYHDTWNGSHIINEMQRSGLKSDAWIYTDMGGYDNDLEKYKKKYPVTKNDYSKIPISIRKPYATRDPIVTYRNFEAQREKFKEITKKTKKNNVWSNVWSTERYFYESVMPTVNMFIDVELEGMIVDWEVLVQHSQELQQNIKEVKEQIWKVFNVPKDFISLDSGPELGVFLELNGWPNVGRGKQKPNKVMVKRLQEYYPDVTIDTSKGVYLTGEDPLFKWKKAGYEQEVDLILKYRELETLFSTFIGFKEDNSGYFQYKKSDDRLHSTFGPMLTNSHRNWSRNPNLQNCPKQGKKAEWYRQIFAVPSKDYYLMEEDQAGLQLRIGAILSGDSVMYDSFVNKDGDLHSTTAVDVLMTQKIEKIIINDNVTLTEYDKVKVIREGKEIEIYATEIKEGDDLIDY